MLNGIVGLLEVHETSVQGPLGKPGMVNEVSRVSLSKLPMSSDPFSIFG